MMLNIINKLLRKTKQCCLKLKYKTVLNHVQFHSFETWGITLKENGYGDRKVEYLNYYSSQCNGAPIFQKWKEKDDVVDLDYVRKILNIA